jgi:hypothetical protein
MSIIFGICFLIVSAQAQCCCDVSTLSGGACSGFCASSDGCFCSIVGGNPACRCGSPSGSACFPSNAACVSANCPLSNWASVLIYSDNSCTNQVGVLSDSPNLHCWEPRKLLARIWILIICKSGLLGYKIIDKWLANSL